MERNFTFWFLSYPVLCAPLHGVHTALSAPPPPPPPHPTHPGTNSLSLLRQEKCISSVEWVTNPQTEPGSPHCPSSSTNDQPPVPAGMWCDLCLCPKLLELLALQQCCRGGGSVVFLSPSHSYSHQEYMKSPVTAGFLCVSRRPERISCLCRLPLKGDVKVAR